MCGQLESLTNDMIDKDTYIASFVLNSDLLQCQYSESIVSTMWSLYIDLNEMVTQEECTLIDGVQVSDYNSLSIYDNTKSNIPVVRPVSVQHWIHYLKMIVTIPTVTKMRILVHYIKVVTKE